MRSWRHGGSWDCVSISYLLLHSGRHGPALCAAQLLTWFCFCDLIFCGALHRGVTLETSANTCKPIPFYVLFSCGFAHSFANLFSFVSLTGSYTDMCFKIAHTSFWAYQTRFFHRMASRASVVFLCNKEVYLEYYTWYPCMRRFCSAVLNWNFNPADHLAILSASCALSRTSICKCMLIVTHSFFVMRCWLRAVGVADWNQIRVESILVHEWRCRKLSVRWVPLGPDSNLRDCMSK